MQLTKDQDVFRSLVARLLLSCALLVGTFIVGTIGYKLLAGNEASLLDCAYMTIITVAGVGFEEVVDLSTHPMGRVFTIFLIVTGMGTILYAISNLTAFIVEGDILLVFRRRRMEKMLEKITNHYVVCGIGRVGRHIVSELVRTDRAVVAIDMAEHPGESFSSEYPDVPVIAGDAVDNEHLLTARIDTAAGLFVATGHDKDNLVITMSARQLNRNLRIVTRCSDAKNHEKLVRAGADSVVSANSIGGLRMASEMIRPTVVSFLDLMLRDQEENLRVEEVTVPEGSRIAGKTVGQLELRSVADVLLLAIKQTNDRWTYNPRDDFEIASGMTLILMGSPENRVKVDRYVR